MSASPTLADVLALDAVRRGRPEVVAAADHLDRPVRWAHVSELADIAGMLRGGELLLTTGVNLPDDDAGLAAYVADLDAAGAAGLVVELGRRFTRALPAPLVRAAEGRGIPLVVLHRETRFVAVTEAVYSLVADAQLAQLRAAQEVHETFTELSVEGADAAEVVRQAARMASAPVVLENLSHQVLAYDARDRRPEDVLDAWEARSRAVETHGRTSYDQARGWLVTTVGARGTDWGRLVLVTDLPAPRDPMLLERAASTLALNRLVERDRESLDRQTHRSLLATLLSHGAPVAETALRAKALGVPLEGRRLVGVVLRPRLAPETAVLEAEQTLRDLGETAATACREARLFALVGALDDASIGILLSAADADRAEAAVLGLAAALADPDATRVLAVGSTVDDLRDVRRSFLEAAQVADAAAHQPSRAFYRLPDVRLRGLVHLLR
ncbi:MAG TPA: PucR family transcriptional regulator ligand-binding domain-containing protein, partial [Candidatus Limnocylindria bacterium]|nr:PucR family transcriptional regulator ligand-binding domain-containing protein [Candidatus Limnocylindria bacterium]